MDKSHTSISPSKVVQPLPDRALVMLITRGLNCSTDADFEAMFSPIFHVSDTNTPWYCLSLNDI